MSVRSLNWVKFGGLVGLAFVLGLLFAGLLDLPKSSVAQARLTQATPAAARVQTPMLASARPLADLSEAFADVAEHVRASVVYVRSQRTERSGQRRLPPGFEDFFFGNPRNGRQPQIERGSGSGFIVSSDGYILTNNHVVDGADQVMVRLPDRHEYTAKVVGTDATTDVAVIKIDAKGLTPAALGSSASVRIGEWVLAIGTPLNENLSFTVTSGIVSAKGRGQLSLPGRTERSIQDFIQTDAAINPGNSGGPLVDVRGEVIGINSAIASQTGYNVGYAFAIPIDLAKQVMNQLITKGRVERAALGVLVQDATPADAKYVGLDEIRGVRVDNFPQDGSPAKTAGIQQGDVIIAVDGQPVEYVAQLQQLVGFRKPGDVVKVEVARKGGVRKTYNVHLIAASEPRETKKGTDGREDNHEDSEKGTNLERIGLTVIPLTQQMIT